MNRPAIIDRGRGPEIAGTRITVFHVLEYQRAGMHRDAIAASFGLSSDQVEAAFDFIREHEDEVDRQYEKIRKRIELGNPPRIEDKLRESRAKLEALRKRLPPDLNQSGTDAQGACVGQ